MLGDNVIAMGGLKLSDNILNIIKSYEIRNVYIWTDGDHAGWEFIEKLVNDYGKLFCKRNLNGKVIFVDHFDPDEVALTEGNIEFLMDTADIMPIFYIERKYSNSNLDYHKSYDMIDYAIRLVDDYDNTTIEYFIHYLYYRTGFDIESIKDRFVEQTNTILYNHKYEQYIIAYLLDHFEAIVQYNIKED
jgi:DNA primase